MFLLYYLFIKLILSLEKLVHNIFIGLSVGEKITLPKFEYKLNIFWH